MHFHCGPDYAVERLGYDPDDLAELPVGATAAFAGDMEEMSVSAA